MAFTLLADQCSKVAASATLSPYSSLPLLPPFLSLSLVHNRGSAFGLLPGYRFLSIATSVILLIGIFLFRRQLSRATARPADLGAALVTGGTAGNLIDRVRLGYVIDFIDIPHWPVFNLADAALVLGTILIVLGIWWQENRQLELSRTERTARK
ncbi:MAG: signal peptidase II [Limnochordales bacterium]|nr:signal peptidase II [Limnochordales bacterium]